MVTQGVHTEVGSRDNGKGVLYPMPDMGQRGRGDRTSQSSTELYCIHWKQIYFDQKRNRMNQVLFYL